MDSLGTIFTRRTIYRGPAFTPKVNSISPPARLRTVGGVLVYLLAFQRAALQTVSLPAVRSFFRDLDDRDRLLSRLGWALTITTPMFVLLAFLVPGAAHAVNPWIKPIKFSISFVTYVWTASLFFQLLPLPSWQRTLMRRATAVSVAGEMLLLGVQAWRTASHPAAGLAGGLLSQTITALVTINTAIMLWTLVLCCSGRARRTADSTLLVAIRNGIVIFLAGNAVGGYMLARGSYTVGAAASAPGLPFLNWSRTGGDLRIAHFIAVHAIQIVPLFAWVLAQMAPTPDLHRRQRAVWAMSAAVLLIVLATFLQAALGHPLVRGGR